jgi:RHS repeat-associated protein
VVKEITYDSFGNIISDTDPLFEVPFGFAGGLYDTDTGLVWFGHRDYDPDIGRWTAKDPIFFAGGDTDLYGYVLNDPVNLIDPTGEIGIAGAAVGAIVGAAGGASAALQNGGGYTSAILGGITGALVGGAVGSVNMFAASVAGAAAGGMAGGLVGGYAGGFVSGALDPCANAWDSARGGAVTGLVGGVFAAPVAYLGAAGTAGATAAWAEGAQTAATGTVGLGAEMSIGATLPSNGIFF